MRAIEWKSTFAAIGCWPPTCHVCEQEISAEAEVKLLRCKLTATGNKAVFAAAHASCGDVPLEPRPEVLAAQEEARTTGRRSGGAYLTEGLDL